MLRQLKGQSGLEVACKHSSRFVPTPAASWGRASLLQGWWEGKNSEGTQRSEAAVGSSVKILGEGFMSRAWSEFAGTIWLGSAWSELMSGDVPHKPSLCVVRADEW